jgi:TonB-dependent SusC/RagA subfamily outer membrane receptor
VVDGREVEAGAAGDSLRAEVARLSASPDLIETVAVLKGEAALRPYGERGRRGVVMITTKAGARRP